MISDLIYYEDSHQFFDDHYAEIEELREEINDMAGEPLTITGDLKNALAWFALSYD